MSYKDTIDAANKTATAAGYTVTADWIQSMSTKLSGEALAFAVLDMVLLGADDRWSGRGNDGARAYQDGVVSAASEWSTNVRYGGTTK